MDWRHEVAEYVRDEVFAVFGRWPETIEEWVVLAQRFGCDVAFYSRLPLSKVRLMESVIHMRVPDSRVPLSHRVYRHELAEAALLWEGREPYCYPAQESRAARHAVARLTEEL